MRKITWTWKKILALICGFLGIGTLTSCYGMPYDLYDIDYASGYVYDDIDGDDEFDEDEGVPGIQVTAYYPSYEYEDGETKEDWLKKNDKLGTATTDENGYFCINFDNAYPEYGFIFKVEDIDGEENGSYKTIIEETDGTLFKLEKADSSETPEADE